MTAEPYINAKQVGMIFGVSHKTVYEWAALGKLQGYKLGRCLRFKESEVRAYAEACKKAAMYGCINVRRAA